MLGHKQLKTTDRYTLAAVPAASLAAMHAAFGKDERVADEYTIVEEQLRNLRELEEDCWDVIDWGVLNANGPTVLLKCSR